MRLIRFFHRKDLYHLKVVERLIPEFGKADQDALHDISMFLKCNIREFLEKYSKLSGEELAEDRYKRFRSF